MEWMVGVRRGAGWNMGPAARISSGGATHAYAKTMMKPWHRAKFKLGSAIRFTRFIHGDNTMKRTLCSALIAGLFAGFAHAGAPAAHPAADASTAPSATASSARAGVDTG